MADQETDTWHMRVSFKPRGYPSGEAWLLAEELDSRLPILREGSLGLDFQPGTPRETITQIAELLNNHVRFITYTGPIRPEWADQPGRGSVARRVQRP